MKVKNLNSHIEYIINGYRQQYLLYEGLLILAKQGEETLPLKEPQRWQEIMEHRSALANNIEEIGKDILGHKKVVMNMLHLTKFSLEEAESLIYESHKRGFQEIVEKIRLIIQEIIATDKRVEANIKKTMKEMSAERKDIKQHFQLQKTYLDRPEEFPEARFFDQKK